MQKALQQINSLAHPTNRPLIIAVSGFGGAGKTTLANKLKIQLTDAQVVCIDSFTIGQHWYRSADWANFDRSRFTQEILQPARGNQFPLVYSHGTWPGQTGSPTVRVPQAKYLIVKGCSIFHPDLLRYYDYKIWVDCPLSAATKRGMWRDKYVHKDPQDYYWQNIWMPNEKEFYDKYHPDKAANIILPALGKGRQSKISRADEHRE